MSATERRNAASGGLDAQTLLLWAVIVLVILAVGTVTVALHLANWMTARPRPLPGNPFVLFFGLFDGTVHWSPAATGCAAALAVVLLAGGAGVGFAVARSRRARSRVDRASGRMGRGRDLGELAGKPAAARAGRLGAVVGQAPGLAVGRTVTGRQLLWQGWEDVSVDIWGPRTGKTTSRAIPAVLAAPGAVVATSNKRDLVDATRDPRAEAGEVWVFDPQNLVGEPIGWWWNPLSYVVDEVKAASLAEVFTAAAREPGSRTDAYFDPRGQQLLADLLLAAALDHRDLTQVYLWLTRPTDDEPAGIVREHGYPLSAASVEEAVNMAEKQRGGVYGTAQKTCAFITNRQAMHWATPGDAHLAGERRQFDPAGFVAGGGTLYLLSKEGSGTAGPLVTALTVAVCEAAETLAKSSPGGRLPVPMVAVLDEAANICRWRELPNLYSHYGSRGIVLMTILQSWSQGVEVWGREGMRKLWSAATVKVYGGGVAERDFLAELSELVGDYDLPQISTSTSSGKGGRSTSISSRRERVLDVADLGALPRGRIIVLGSGARPTLASTLPWMDGPHAAAVRASIAAHDPAATSSPVTADLTAPSRIPDAHDAETASIVRWVRSR